MKKEVSLFAASAFAIVSVAVLLGVMSDGWKTEKLTKIVKEEDKREKNKLSMLALCAEPATSEFLQ